MIRSRAASAALGVAGAVGVLAAAGARRPVVRRWPASILQAAPCTPASEAPRGMMLLHAALGVAALARGARAAVGANALAVAALAGLAGDAARSAAALDAAVPDVAVPGVAVPDVTVPDVTVPDVAASGVAASGVAASGGPSGAGAAVQAARLLSGRRARRRHLRAADLAYGDHPQQRLDVWAAPDAGPAAPVLVQVHGGGWTGGDKRVSAWPLLAHLVDRGWVCVTINYRLAPAHRLPDQVADVRRALDWVAARIAGYGGDPGFVAVSGGSAGGHLAALAAVTGSPVAAAVPLYGVHDFSVDEHGLRDLLRDTAIGTDLADDPQGWHALSPLHRAGSGAPPFLVIHGSADTIVSVGQSRRFVARLREVSEQPVAYAELPHAQHGFDAFPTARTGHTVRAIHRFLAEIHARHGAERAASPAV